jgi:hypothetical protein
MTLVRQFGQNQNVIYNCYVNSASARISKGQGYQGFLMKRAGSSFGQKRAICVVQGKGFEIFQTLDKFCVDP